MMTRYSTIICIVIGVIAIAAVAYFLKIDYYCNCTGYGVQVDYPTNTFWRGAWPRERSAIPLNAPSRWGTYPTGSGCSTSGCSTNTGVSMSSPSPGNDFGWPQMAETPFAGRAHYAYPSISVPNQPYMIGADSIRDIRRDMDDGLLDSGVQKSFGQMELELAAAQGSKCCSCGTSASQYGLDKTAFLPLSSIEGAQLPPGAVTDARPFMNDMGLRLRFGDGRYGDLGVGIL